MTEQERTTIRMNVADRENIDAARRLRLQAEARRRDVRSDVLAMLDTRIGYIRLLIAEDLAQSQRMIDLLVCAAGIGRTTNPSTD